MLSVHDALQCRNHFLDEQEANAPSVMSQEHDAPSPATRHRIRQSRYEQKLRSVTVLEEEVFRLRTTLRDLLLAKGQSEKADLALVERRKPRRAPVEAGENKKARKKAQRDSLLEYRRALYPWLKQEKARLANVIEITKAAPTETRLTPTAASEIMELLMEEGIDF